MLWIHTSLNWFELLSWTISHSSVLCDTLTRCLRALAQCFQPYFCCSCKYPRGGHFVTQTLVIRPPDIYGQAVWYFFVDGLSIACWRNGRVDETDIQQNPVKTNTFVSNHCPDRSYLSSPGSSLVLSTFPVVSNHRPHQNSKPIPESFVTTGFYCIWQLKLSNIQ